MRFKYNNLRGFTLIELVTTLAIVSVLALFIVPSFSGLIKESRLTAQMNNLRSALSFTRSAAVERGINVSFCSSDDGVICKDPASWHSGWIVFVDKNANGVVNSEDSVIRQFEGLKAGNRLTFNNGYYTGYNALGIVANSKAGTFVLCDDRGASSAKALVVNLVGRVRTALDSDNDGTVNSGNGNNVTC